MKFAVLVFPGSNCDKDMYHAVEDCIRQSVDYVWHTESDLSAYDCILVPGGFSYGDYLRCGAIARFAPVMQSLAEAAARGVYVLGVCNGFQILTESGLLPGVLMPNQSLKFRCHQTPIIVENNETPFTTTYAAREEISLPIAHGEGNYYVDETTLRDLEANRQIIFRYKQDDNPNGSTSDIAGVSNKSGNVIGMMPHPERAVHDWLGSIDGKRMFESIFDTWRERNDTTVAR